MPQLVIVKGGSQCAVHECCLRAHIAVCLGLSLSQRQMFQLAAPDKALDLESDWFCIQSVTEDPVSGSGYYLFRSNISVCFLLYFSVMEFGMYI